MGKSKDRQKQVILNYKANGGNMKKAMIDAGYSETYADRNSKYLLGIIGDEIKAQQDEICNEKIKNIAKIQEWWSSVVDEEGQDMNSKIKCSELLARSLGAFIDKLKVDANVDTDLNITIELSDDE